jgi:hypothetical protein
VSNGQPASIGQLAIDWMPDFLEGSGSKDATWESIAQRVEGYRRGLEHGLPLTDDDAVRLKSIFHLEPVFKEHLFHAVCAEGDRRGCGLPALMCEPEAKRTRPVHDFMAAVRISTILLPTIAGYMRLYGIDPAPVIASSSPYGPPSGTWEDFRGAVMAGLICTASAGDPADRTGESAPPVDHRLRALKTQLPPKYEPIIDELWDTGYMPFARYCALELQSKPHLSSLDESVKKRAKYFASAVSRSAVEEVTVDVESNGLRLKGGPAKN